jgi:gamma-glutamyltranspeptidase/glutathione hydrolase
VRSTAVASEESAERAAFRTLEQGGTSADALVAGFLAAAAERASVLFAPVLMLLAGTGVGARAFDGRCRQPGLGGRRPRGILPDDRTPPAAQVAVPGSLGALSLLHAHDGHLAFDKLAAPAAARALSAGAEHRAAVLERLAQLGAKALSDARIARPLLAAAGPAEGGLLTLDDLANVRPEGAPPRDVPLGASESRAPKASGPSEPYRLLLLPWPAPKGAYLNCEIVAALDTRGVLGVLGYAPDDEGFVVGELGLTLPRAADVVRRGVPRTRPGEALACAAPIALLFSENKPFMALGVRANRNLSPDALAAATAESNVAAEWVKAAQRACRGSAAFAVVRPSSGPDPGRIVVQMKD